MNVFTLTADHSPGKDWIQVHLQSSVQQIQNTKYNVLNQN